MSDQIREQISAFLDGELPAAESELLMKRLLRDPGLRDSFGRYALVGEAMRGSRHISLRRDFGAAVNSAIDSGEQPAAARAVAGGSRRWFRPLAGAAVAASVAVVAIVALQYRTLPGGSPTEAMLHPAPPAAVTPHAASVPQGTTPVVAKSGEERVYTTPQSNGGPQNPIAGARLANYVIAHSQYSSVLSQRDLMTDVIVAADPGTGDTVAAEPVASSPR
jgi:sigma-E factor negative regulatory protein RseA